MLGEIMKKNEDNIRITKIPGQVGDPADFQYDQKPREIMTAIEGMVAYTTGKGARGIGGDLTVAIPKLDPAYAKLLGEITYECLYLDLYISQRITDDFQRDGFLGKTVGQQVSKLDNSDECRKLFSERDIFVLKQIQEIHNLLQHAHVYSDENNLGKPALYRMNPKMIKNGYKGISKQQIDNGVTTIALKGFIPISFDMLNCIHSLLHEYALYIGSKTNIVE
jgi:hypothetical protein